MPAWDGNFYFGSILEVTQRLSVSPLMIHICCLSWHFSYSLVSPGELVVFARYNRSDLKTYVGRDRVSVLPPRSKEEGIRETLSSFTGKLLFSKAKQILQNIILNIATNAQITSNILPLLSVPFLQIFIKQNFDGIAIYRKRISV